MTTKRQMLIDPYSPDFTENLGDNTGQYADTDIGKAVKYSGDTMILVTANDQIDGFVMSVEPGTKDGHSVGSVRKRGRVWAVDSAGTLAVGNRVQSGAVGTLGTLANHNVVVLNTVTYTEPLHAWVVVRVDSGGAGRAVMLERL